MLGHIERARELRERAEHLRRIAAELARTEHCPVLEQTAREYEEMAEAEVAMSLVRIDL